MVNAKMVLVLKFSEIHAPVSVVKDGWLEFSLNTDSGVVAVTLKPKMFKKLEEAAAAWPQWVAALTGKMGAKTEKGFVLAEPSLQVFEKKAKDPAPAK